VGRGGVEDGLGVAGTEVGGVGICGVSRVLVVETGMGVSFIPRPFPFHARVEELLFFGFLQGKNAYCGSKQPPLLFFLKGGKDEREKGRSPRSWKGKKWVNEPEGERTRSRRLVLETLEKMTPPYSMLVLRLTPKLLLT